MRKLLLPVFLFFLLQTANAQNKTLLGFSVGSVIQEGEWEEKFDQALSTQHVDKLIREMSAHPHNIGSAGTPYSNVGSLKRAYIRCQNIAIKRFSDYLDNAAVLSNK